MTPGTETPAAADAPRRVTIEEALARLPGANGERFARVLEHGTLGVEIYAPRGADPQQPHTRDEAYVVVRGSGEFINGDRRHPEIDDSPTFRLRNARPGSA